MSRPILSFLILFVISSVDLFFLRKSVFYRDDRQCLTLRRPETPKQVLWQTVNCLCSISSGSALFAKAKSRGGLIKLMLTYKVIFAAQCGKKQISHRTTGCFDDRLLTMMTDMGFYVP